MKDSEAESAALEQVRWCRCVGLSPAEALQLFAGGWDHAASPNWDQVTWEFGREYRRMLAVEELGLAAD
jgi:hypothetical protein